MLGKVASERGRWEITVTYENIGCLANLIRCPVWYLGVLYSV